MAMGRNLGSLHTVCGVAVGFCGLSVSTAVGVMALRLAGTPARRHRKTRWLLEKTRSDFVRTRSDFVFAKCRLASPRATIRLARCRAVPLYAGCFMLLRPAQFL